MCNIRKEFDNYNLISALHTYFSVRDKIYQNVLPPLKILSVNDKKKIFNNLEKLNFNTNNLMVA